MISDVRGTFILNIKTCIMKKNRIIITTVVTLLTVVVVSGFANRTELCEKSEFTKTEKKQTINMFVSHGHCSTPFAGTVKDLKLDYMKRTDGGNPLEEMKLSFNVDPNTFNVCAGEELTKKIKTPGLFINEDSDMITFRTTEVFTMGLDWYQINGKLSIKGEERAVKFFATGIRDPKQSNATQLILEGQFNLNDWGIDYDKIVNGKSDLVPTKWMHLNMRFEVI
jgi:hypothetical protein